MGLLKKIFKPVSKVLDKIVPNEVKPFLPYAAAFAPMLAPGIMGAFGGSALSRAAIGGGLNIFGQLAQEDNEGDINLLSAGLGALTGAMTGPGAADKFSSMTTKGAMDPALGSSVQGDILANRSFLTKATDAGLEGLAKGSEMFAAGMADPFSMAGLKAAALPAATATGDLMFAQAKRDQDEYDRMMEEDAAADAESDAQRAFAIRRAMEATGATEEEIEDAIYAAGYKAGGRVGFDSGGGLMDTVVGMFKKEDKGPDFGGITEAVKNIEEKPKEVLVDKLKVTIEPGQSEMRAIIEAMYNDVDGVMPDDRKNQFYELYSPQMYRNGEMDKAEFEFIQTEILGKEIPKMAEGGLMDLGGKEMDMRGGGFIPIGEKERADDVPARLSKNEFVMTADAVRAAGGGSVNEGAKRMYETMNKLEARA